MTDSLLPIAGLAPSAATITLLYTAPGSSGKATIFDLMALCTDPTVADVYEIWVCPTAAGAPTTQDDQLRNKVCHHQPLAALERQQIGGKYQLAATDKVYVRSTNGTVTFRGSVVEQT